MHGDDPRAVIEHHLANGVEKLVCLGDYDTPQVLKTIRKLKIPKILIVGNHDFHYVKRYGLTSRDMKMDAGGYADLWNEHPAEKEFVQKAIAQPNQNAGILVSEKVRKRMLAYVHGSLLGNDTEDPDVPGFVWGRMRNADKIVANFTEMDRLGFEILFRGHDHVSAVFTRAKSDKENPYIMERDGYMHDRVLLKASGLHIVSVGAFYHGEYAVFDDKKMEVRFHRDVYQFKRQGP